MEPTAILKTRVKVPEAGEPGVTAACVSLDAFGSCKLAFRIVRNSSWHNRKPSFCKSVAWRKASSAVLRLLCRTKHVCSSCGLVDTEHARCQHLCFCRKLIARSSLLNAVMKLGRSARGPCSILDSTYAARRDFDCSQCLQVVLRVQDDHLSGGI